MLKRFNTKIGDRYGSRVVTGFLQERDNDGHLRITWRCDCGAVGSGGLKSIRHTTTCARCRHRHRKQIDQSIHGHASRAGRTHLYDAWANMMQRVRGTGSERNKRWYAEINACPEWEKFEGFRDWAMVNGYQPGLSLDRLDPLGDYEPGNCEWVSRSENSRRALAEMRRLAAIGRQVELQRLKS